MPHLVQPQEFTRIVRLAPTPQIRIRDTSVLNLTSVNAAGRAWGRTRLGALNARHGAQLAVIGVETGEVSPGD